MSTFKVSVIIPVYNTQQYLRNCLESVVNQTLRELDIILIDDGSTDASFAIMKEYQKRDPERIQLISKENGGQAAARNLAIPLCRGEYIGFVDSDDTIKPDMYEKMYQKARETDSDYVECDYVNVKVNEQGEQVRIADYGGRVRKYSSKKDMFLDIMVAPWNKIYRTSLLQRSGITFPEGLIYEDTGFCLKAISCIQRYEYVDQKFVVHYFRNSSTMNRNRSTKVADILAVLQDVVAFYQEKGLYDQYKEELEYEITRILLCSSMKRISQIQDKKLRNKVCQETWNMITAYFPEYRKNKYIKEKGIKNLYMRCVNSWNITYICNGLSFKKDEA